MGSRIKLYQEPMPAPFDLCHDDLDAMMCPESSDSKWESRSQAGDEGEGHPMELYDDLRY